MTGQMVMTVITFAHRGAPKEAPENTLPAFRRALELGATGLETDVWLSADGEVVCTHDATLRAGLRRYRISTTTAATLAELGVPRLADVYAELGTEFELSVDVKEHAAARGLVDVGPALRRPGAALGVLARPVRAAARCGTTAR